MNNNIENKFQKGDRVTRKNVNAFRYMQGIKGTVMSITYDSRCFIKWDIKTKTNQQHSTVSHKFLNKLPQPTYT